MRISFKVSLTVSIMAVVGSLSLIFFFHVRSVSNQASQEAASSLFNAAFATIEDAAFGLIDNAFETVHLASELNETALAKDPDKASEPMRIILQLLRRNPSLYSIYYGHEDGSFLQVISARQAPQILTAHAAPQKTFWIFRAISLAENRQRVQNWIFLDQDLGVLEKRSEPGPQYDPRQRPWYRAALKTDQATLSSVYTFNSLQQPGITASKKTAEGSGIVGVDLTLQELKNLVSGIRISDNSHVLIMDDNDRIIARSDTREGTDPVEALSGPSGTVLSQLSTAPGSGLKQVAAGSDAYYAKASRTTAHGSSLKVMVLAPVNDFNSHFVNVQNNLTRITVIWLLLFAPVTYFFSRHMANRLSVIAWEAGRIKDLHFERREKRPSRILEFFLLEKNFDAMRASLHKKTRDLGISQGKLNRLVELGISISAERNAEKLMERVLLGAKELTNADGGTLYKIEGDTLKFKIIHNDTLGIKAGQLQDEKITRAPVPLYDDKGRENHHNVVSHAIWESQSIRIDDAYHNDKFDFSGTRAFDQVNHYHSKSFLTIPLMPLGGKPIGALQLINCKDDEGHVTPFSEEMVRFVEALGAQAATILYNLELLEGQKRLLDSTIQIIAGAIDAKSPYTGGHCKRVPELAMMIAKEACNQTDGRFADFSFKNDDEWREFSIGAWLHDCGKVVTPEYVVDKATKLETIYNRIHEIRTRFEVLLRDARVDYYKGIAEGGKKERLEEAYEARKKDLIDKFAFVAQCNEGGEFMSEESLARLEQIAKEEWVRHFDITLGLSHEEKDLYRGYGTLPAKETLLADRPYHIIQRNRDVKDQYAHLGFKLPVPEHLYNRGELYNLSVQRGTLTHEERFKISEHIMQTIAMLEKMPFPPQLARVPEYAGTHHETMIGTGYPRQLHASELSWPSRIMAVADIFEALTASDRPYKKAKPLSDAIRILSFFKKDQHIDPDVFDLFLSSGVYKEYALKYLRPEQIDDVDIAAYLS